MSEKPGRYQRSTSGLIAAMVVTLLAVGVFWTVRSLSRTEVEVEREPVDFAASAEAARDAGFDVVAPETLPEGWIATDIDLTQTDPPEWGMAVLTADGKFVGLRQEDQPVDDLIEFNVDEDAVEGEPLSLDSAVGSSWQSWTDEGGDTGYAIAHAGQTVLVYGSAPPEDLQRFITLLER